MQTYTFICGCGHSGTSLLANMFASHKDVFIPRYETNTFWRRRKMERVWPVLQEEAASSGKSHFAEKTPRHIHRFNIIRENVPNPKFIALIRDPRDVAASYVKRLDSAEFGITRWIKDNVVLISEKDKGDVFIQKYEDIIEDAEGCLKNMCEFTGIPYSKDMVNYHQEKRLWFGRGQIRKGTGRDGREHVHLRNWQINQPIFDTRGKWRNVLSKEDLELFKDENLVKMMDYFGYL